MYGKCCHGLTGSSRSAGMDNQKGCCRTPAHHTHMPHARSRAHTPCAGSWPSAAHRPCSRSASSAGIVWAGLGEQGLGEQGLREQDHASMASSGGGCTAPGWRLCLPSCESQHPPGWSGRAAGLPSSMAATMQSIVGNRSNQPAATSTHLDSEVGRQAGDARVAVEHHIPAGKTWFR